MANEIKCLKVFNANAVIHIFYYRGKIHCVTSNDFIRMCNYSATTVRKYLEERRPYEKILNHEYSLKNTFTEKINYRDITPKQLRNQNLLMKVFKQKR